MWGWFIAVFLAFVLGYVIHETSRDLYEIKRSLQSLVITMKEKKESDQKKLS